MTEIVGPVREGFDKEHFEVLAQLEDGSFWFQARNKAIIWAIQTYFPEAESFLEIGCGTGFVLSAIRESFPTLSLTGSELYEEGLKYARQRLPGVSLIQLDARQANIFNEFDIVGLFDVLEHIEDDRRVLDQVAQALKSGGKIILTVPQHGFLWSPSDDLAHHVRRYSRKEMFTKLAAAGFVVEHATSFVSLLFPLMVCSRIFQRIRKPRNYDVFAEASVGGLLKAVLNLVMTIELSLVRLGVDFKYGGSLLVIAKKA